MSASNSGKSDRRTRRPAHRATHPAARRPRRAELDAARGGTIRDVLEPDLDVWFCGINPSLYSAAVGHHFARPGNRFWPALEASGFTPRRLHPTEDGELPRHGGGLTNFVARATARADELAAEEIVEGARILQEKAARLRPRVIAFLGVTAYRLAYGLPEATIGAQRGRRIADARVWVLPNPSGLNAHYQLPELARLFRRLRAALRRAGAR